MQKNVCMDDVKYFIKTTVNLKSTKNTDTVLVRYLKTARWPMKNVWMPSKTN